MMQGPRIRENPPLFFFLTRRGLVLSALLAVLCVVGYRVIRQEEWFQDHYPTKVYRQTFAVDSLLKGSDLNAAQDSFISGINSLRITVFQGKSDTTIISGGMLIRSFK